MANDNRLDNTKAPSFPNTQQQRVRQYNIRDSYRLVTWAFACVNAIADSISGVPLQFFTLGKEGARVPLPDNHEVMKLFAPPQQWEIPSQREMIRQTFILQGAWGEAFHLYDQKETVIASDAGQAGASGGQINQKAAGMKVKKPKNVWVKPGFLFEAVTDAASGDLKGWKYNPQGSGTFNDKSKDRILTPGEVVQFKYYDPYNRYRGLAPAMAGRLAFEQEVNMAIWNAGFFQGGVRNPIAISMKGSFGSDKQRQEYVAQIKKDYQGFVRGQGPLILEGGSTVAPLLNSLKDLDFIEGKKLTREEICALFGVPPAQVGIFEYANYANSREQTKLFWVNTLLPKMMNFTDTLYAGLLSVFWPGVYCDWDWSKIEALRPDPVVKATAGNLTASAVKTFKECGYEPEVIAEILDMPALAKVEFKEEEEPDPKAGKPKKDPKDEEDDNETTSYVIRNGEETLRMVEMRPSGLEKFVTAYERNVIDYFADQYASFHRGFVREMVDDLTCRVYPTNIEYRARWETGVRAVIRRIFIHAQAKAGLEIANPTTAMLSTLPILGLHKMSENGSGSAIDFFCKQTAAAVIEPLMSYVSTILKSDDPDRKALLETPAALIETAVSLTDAKATVARVYSHARFLAMESKGVLRHTWASSPACPCGHGKLHGKSVMLGADFAVTVGRYPNENTGAADEKTCLCTTFASTLSVNEVQPVAK